MKHKHNTPMKMLTTVLLLLLTLAVTLSGCAYPSNQVGDSESTTTTAITTTERADGLKKIYCQATLEDDFVDNKILFGVFPEYNEYEYTVDDFADVGCIDYKEIMTYKPGKPNSRIMRITLDKHSKENVLAMIKKLEAREDIRYAEPSYYQSIEAVANDIQYTNGNQ